MLKLTKPLYDAIVVGDETDRSLSGAVRIKIIGVTDEVDDDVQPLALPAVNSMMAVPTSGSYLKVYFEDGDIHQPFYLLTSPQKSYLPDEYIENYPNVAVSNLGSDFFQMIHNRVEKSTLIEHDSNSQLQWNAFGKITHDTEKAFDNTGVGAKEGNGKRTQRVVTEGSIDIFTCTPHSGGSEYFEVAHVSKASVQGTTEREQKDVAQTTLNSEDTGFETPETRTVGDSTVEFLQAKNFIKSTNRKIKLILIGNTGKSDFTESVNSLLTSTVSTHYIIGREANEFIQMVDLPNIATFGSKAVWNKEKNINKICISVLLAGNGKDSYSDDQYINLVTVIRHVRDTYGSEIEFKLISDLDPLMKDVFGNSFDEGKLVI